jgi:hypothetical protein
LGNVFAHSFLVRENLLLGAALLGLLYSLSGMNTANVTNHLPVVSGRTRLLGLLTTLVLLIGITIEVAPSFGKMPFQAGADCFVKDVRSSSDGWTLGSLGGVIT